MTRMIQSSPLGRLVEGVSNWRTARATRRALWSLSDYELDDIGLSRADIENISRR